jgi:phenylacetic acid degradation operon negative regulatory protein
LLLRDPELPDALLPADWSGKQARLICKSLYLQLEAASEQALDRVLSLANGGALVRNQALGGRFRAEEK